MGRAILRRAPPCALPCGTRLGTLREYGSLAPRLAEPGSQRPFTLKPSMYSGGNVMRQLYLVIPGTELTRRLVGELGAEGLEHQSIRLFARRPERLDDLPVSATGLSPRRRTLVLPALAGATLALAAAPLAVAICGAIPSPGLALVAVTVAGAIRGSCGPCAPS